MKGGHRLIALLASKVTFLHRLTPFLESNFPDAYRLIPLTFHLLIFFDEFLDGLRLGLVVVQDAAALSDNIIVAPGLDLKKITAGAHGSLFDKNSVEFRLWLSGVRDVVRE